MSKFYDMDVDNGNLGVHQFTGIVCCYRKVENLHLLLHIGASFNSNRGAC